MKIKNVKMIEVGEWDKLVKNTYKRTYSFQQQDGCKDRGTFNLIVPDEADDFENDTIPEIVNHEKMGVSFKAWLSRDPKEPLKELKDRTEQYTIDLWWKRNFYPNIQMIANDLHSKGLLDAGEYVINIDW